MMTLRKILFAAFVLIFASLCPWLIFHSLRALNAGLAVIETVPRESTILLNGKEVAQQTPLTLPDLQTGTYLLQAQKSGYYPYEQSLVIRKGEATVLNPLVLIPDSSQVKKWGEGRYDTLIPLEGTSYSLVMNASTPAEVALFCSEHKTFRSLFPEGFSEEALKIERIFTVPGSPIVVMKIQQSRKEIFLRIVVSETTQKIQDITNLMADDVQEILWSADQPEWLFAYRNEEIDVLNLKRNSKVANFADEWVGLGLGDGNVYGVNEEGQFFLKDYTGKILETETTEFDFKKGFLGREKFVRIYPLASGSVLLHEIEGSLWQSDLPNLLSDRVVRGLQISEETGDVLVWTDHELGIRQAIAPEDDARIFNEGWKIKWLVEGVPEMTSPAFVQKGSQVLYGQGDEIFLVDLNQDLTPRTVLTILPGSAFHYVAGELIALDAESGQVISLPLGPQEEQPSKVKSLGVLLEDVL
ncbi:PEGA domain-containing protein [Kiritimatiellota bacterium B12222]|nr:PEGA domain-containing protein [Kiritimatiellota bacterium B12222]